MGNSLIWVDKYRPKTFNDIVGQDYFVSRIKQFVEKKSLPHLLFSGTPGTGKTTTALVIAREMYGEDALSGNFLELNASDDRGIDVIRNKIKEFARLKSLTDIPYKVICLDEADSLTKEAQQALRRTMEKYSSSCRFILACNEVSKIIDPIQSRCVVFKFKPLQDQVLRELIERVENNEEISVEEEAKEKLIRVSKGDVRNILNTLQASSSIETKITSSILDEVLDFVDPKEIEEMLEQALEGDFYSSRDSMIKLKNQKGLTGLEILKEIYKKVLDLDIDNQKKLKFIDRIANIEFRLVEGSDEEIQLEALLALISLLGK